MNQPTEPRQKNHQQALVAVIAGVGCLGILLLLALGGGGYWYYRTHPSSGTALPIPFTTSKREQANQCLSALRILDSAKDQYAIEHNKGPGTVVPPADLLIYVKPGTPLYLSLQAGVPRDALNNPITLNTIEAPPQISPETKAALSDALGPKPEDFWGAYK